MHGAKVKIYLKIFFFPNWIMNIISVHVTIVSKHKQKQSGFSHKNVALPYPKIINQNDCRTSGIHYIAM